MRPALLLCLSVALGHAAKAQFSIVPQLGLETSRTEIAYNKQIAFAPLGGKVSLQPALRLEYAFKKGHGLFAGLATSRSLVTYAFSDLATGMSAYTASRGNTQLRLEGGYQIRTKPLYFKKATVTPPAKSQYQKSGRTGCSKSLAQSGCGSKIGKQAAKPDRRSWMRMQPALGVAYIPATAPGAINETAASYAYNAGNWQTAVTSGIGFVFGKGTQNKYTVSLNYLKGLSNLGERRITTMVDNKPVTTSLKSAASSWNLRMGVPISFAKKQTVVKQQAVEKPVQKQRCGQYKSYYKSRCTRTI